MNDDIYENDIYEKEIDADNVYNDLTDADILNYCSVERLNLNEYWKSELLAVMDGSIPSAGTYGEWIEAVAGEIEDRHNDVLNNITLNTPLEQIGWSDANSIGEHLIDLKLAGGDEWGQEWDCVQRAGGTVEDLRDELYYDE